MGTSAGDTAQMLAALMYAQQQQKNQQQQQPQHSNRSADTSAAILAALRAAGGAPAVGAHLLLHDLNGAHVSVTPASLAALSILILSYMHTQPLRVSGLPLPASMAIRRDLVIYRAFSSEMVTRW